MVQRRQALGGHAPTVEELDAITPGEGLDRIVARESIIDAQHEAAFPPPLKATKAAPNARPLTFAA